MVRDGGRPPAVAGGVLLLLVICIVDCASEQGLMGKDSKTATLVERANSWRSQRGGSCLSYGHSCWGAHGKRSGKPFVRAPVHDWYLGRLLKRMDLNQLRQPMPIDNSDASAIFRVDVPEDVEINRLIDGGNEETPVEVAEVQKAPNAIPMLDDAALTRARLIQIMRDASEKK